MPIITRSNSKVSPFQKLPSEIPNQIYAQVFSEKEIHLVPRWSIFGSSSARQVSNSRALLQVNRWIRNEAAFFMYCGPQRRQLTFRDRHELQDFVQSIDFASRSHVKIISITDMAFRPMYKVCLVDSILRVKSFLPNLSSVGFEFRASGFEPALQPANILREDGFEELFGRNLDEIRVGIIGCQGLGLKARDCPCNWWSIKYREEKDGRRRCTFELRQGACHDRNFIQFFHHIDQWTISYIKDTYGRQESQIAWKSLKMMAKEFQTASCAGCGVNVDYRSQPLSYLVDRSCSQCGQISCGNTKCSGEEVGHSSHCSKCLGDRGPVILKGARDFARTLEGIQLDN